MADYITWGWIAYHSGDSLGLLAKISVAIIVCCLITAFVSPAWPVAVMGLLFIAFGASVVWNFGGTLLASAMFATAYKFIDSYVETFGVLTAMVPGGLEYLLLAARAGLTGFLCQVH